MKRALLTLIALPVAAHVLVSVFRRPAPAGGDFTLRSTRGAVSLRDFRGEVVLLYFGYRCAARSASRGASKRSFSVPPGIGPGPLRP